MNIQLRWIASHSASCLHAVDVLCRGGTLVDQRLNPEFAGAANDLCREVESCNLPLTSFLDHLVPLSAGIENNQQLTELALRKVVGGQPNPQAISHIAARIGVAESTLLRIYPNLVDTLSLRGGPLREQWEARGPGLLTRLAQITDKQLFVDRADVILVHPASGGGGTAHLRYNSVRIEAVLANPEPRLPEVIRLGWMLAQLHCDLPIHSEQLPADRVAPLAQLAFLPPTLAAGEYVELNACDLASVELALKFWGVVTPDTNQTAGILFDWWLTYQDSKPRWEVALRALDQMLRGAF